MCLGVPAYGLSPEDRDCCFIFLKQRHASSHANRHADTHADRHAGRHVDRHSNLSFVQGRRRQGCTAALQLVGCLLHRDCIPKVNDGGNHDSKNKHSNDSRCRGNKGMKMVMDDDDNSHNGTVAPGYNHRFGYRKMCGYSELCFYAV